MRRAMLRLAVLLLYGLKGLGSELCLDDGVPESQRKYIQDEAGHDIPIGVFQSNWASSWLLNKLTEMLLQEVMGYHATLDTRMGANGASCFYALPGCLDFDNKIVAEKQCGINETTLHISVDSWVGSYASAMDQFNKEFPRIASQDLGSMGYAGEESMYVSQAILNSAYADSGLALDFYKSYNTTHHDPRKYFDSIHDVDLSELELCSETDMSNPSRMGDYAKYSGDYDGVVSQPDGTYIAKCTNDRWWYAPACRQNSSQCIPLFTSGNGWKLQALMQWSTAYGMPTAVGLSKGYATWIKHVQNHRALHYWWVPDSTFIDMLPEPLTFARHSATEWWEGDKKTGAKGSYVSKLVSHNLQAKAGRVREFVSNMNFELPEVQNLLLELQQSGSTYNVSCKWMKENRDRWMKWKPVETACYEGFGLVDASGAFVSSRADAVGCGLCQAGSASEELIDDQGRTFQCKLCAPGYSQANTYSTQCPRCWRDVWWLAPACRNSTDCFPCLTGSASGYNVILAEEVMQKAAFWHMPLALGVAHYNGSSDFSSLVLSQRDVLFMFWEPSVEFQAVDPMFVRFPDFNETQWAFNVMASKREATWPITVVSNELAQLAPDVRVLLQRMLLSLEDLNQMLQFSYDSLERFDRCFSCAARSGACQWLRAQGTDAIWKPWIPKKGACFAGQGMYSITERRFVGSRGDDVICVACTAGRFSRLVQDEMGDTADCRPCAKGYFQPSSSAVSCDPCPMGRFAASARSAYCESCPIGTYQAKEASSACVDCPIGMTTWGLEAFSFFFCTCQEGWYRIGLESNCSECPAGMHCPGEAFLPQQKAGFWAYTTNLIQRDPNVAVVSVGSLGSSGVLYGPPYSVYQCRNELQCPAGEVMTCAKNRIGQACGSCMKGHSAQFDGTCKICDGESLWPVFLMLFVSLALLPLIVAAGLIMTKARRTALSVFMVSLIFGQIVVCLQGLDAIYQLDLTWKDPAKAILAALAVFNLDLEFSCLLPPQSYTVEYVLKLLAYPAVVFITFLAWLSTRCSKHAVPFNAFVNVHGLFVVALLTALSLTVVRPLQCRSNPNGLFTVSSRPDLTCWETEEHQTLVVFVSIGILAYPVTILSCIAYLTRKYPIWLRSGGGIKVMERYRFLFARFRPERYYFGLILSVHNLTVAVIPAALVAFPALQVGIMGCVICSKLVAQILLWPWRMDLANYNDAALSAGLMTILLLASPLLNIDQGQTRQSVAVLLSCVMILLPLVAIFIAFAVVLARLRPQSKFGAFLCHHKAGAGALCRFFKLVAKKYVNINLFLDSDELDDLARIFDIVKADTRSLVVVLTSELLHRMWCAGEIATAHKHQIPIIPLYCDDFGFPDASCIATMESVWSEEQRGTLVSHGISMEDIKAAYRSLRTLPGVDLKRRWSLEAQEDAVLQVLTAVYERGPRVEVATAPSVKSAKVLVCVTEEAEAISAGFILQQMVQTKLQTVTFLARTPEDVFESASFALVILSKGILEDCGFAQILLAIRRASVALVPVNDGSFDFPGLEFYQQVQEGNLVIPGLAPNQGPPLARAFQALLSILALPMTPHASIGILERQVDQICQRFGNWDDVVERSSSVKSSSRRPMSELEDAMEEEMKEIGGCQPGEIMTILFKQ
ncbi:unnamed protein product [Durusdinium trenchii]|uniref:Tyrosine-protein kinase ephrin type A/B receptor-like domain-containing protein n=1 Tax=Durusdinium trenchii TaxID=1381693 RepID=A0ABP0HWY9_9DINO